MIGYSRLIISNCSDEDLQLEELYIKGNTGKFTVEKGISRCEISRLCIVKEHRSNRASMYLIYSCIAATQYYNIEHTLTLSEDRLIRFFVSSGIKIYKISESIDYDGERFLYLIDSLGTINNLNKEQSMLYKKIEEEIKHEIKTEGELRCIK